MTHILSKIYICLTVVGLIWLTAACSDDVSSPDGLQPDSPGTITLHLRTSRLSRSNDSDNAEFALKNLYVAFYEKVKSASGPLGTSDRQDDVPPVYLVKLDEDNIKSNGDDTYVTMKLTDEIILKLFGSSPEDGAKGVFYVLANIFPPNELSDAPTIADLMNMAISTDFMSKQESFVMAGEPSDYSAQFCEVEYTAPSSGDIAGKVTGEASLVRAAAKIRLNVKFAENVTTTDTEGAEIKWTPVVTGDALKVLINNGVDEAITVPVGLMGRPWKPSLGLLPGNPGGDMDMLSDDAPVLLPDPYFSSSLKTGDSYRILSDIGGSAPYPYQMDVPLYTYPNAWEEDVEEIHKTTLTLIVPWHKDGDPEGSNYTYYYKVPITDTQTPFIERNTSYTINLNVGVLGSLTPEDPVELDDLSYKVVDWSEEEVEVAIPEVRYLVVNPSTYTFNNESVMSIPFYTSHDVEIYEIEMSYPQFNYPDNGSGEVVTIPVSKSVIDATNARETGHTFVKYDIVRDPISKQLNIRIDHPMQLWHPRNATNGTVGFEKVGPVNTDGSYNKEALTERVNSVTHYGYNNENAYFPYTFKLKVRHIDNYAFSEEVTITQYPGMYIEADRNYGGNYMSYYYDANDVDDEIRGPVECNYGYTFLNAEKVDIGSNNVAWRNSDLWEPLTILKDVNLLESTVRENYWNYYHTGLGGLRPFQGLGTGSNVTNPNMYVINITQLSSSGQQNEYIIGDPRSGNINNLLTNESMESGSSEAADDWNKSAVSLYGESERTLNFYYPTNESDEYKMMVAPKLRISSAFGFVRVQYQIIDCTSGRRRAATYQEQGYPAGRWRLPTFGEVEFIVKLSKQEKIPTLFSTNQSYLTAQGAYYITTDGKLIPTQDYLTSTNLTFDRGVPFGVRYVRDEWQLNSQSGVNVRPVYDEWYWEKQDGYQLEEEESGGYVYTYGDMPVKTTTYMNKRK